MKSVTKMAKYQNLSSLKFEDLPDEIILQVLKNLDIKDIANCVIVSKRIRAICEDLSIFEKINLYKKVVPIGFVQLVLNSGCKYFSLYSAKLIRGSSGLYLKKPSKLRYLELKYVQSTQVEAIEEILTSCYSLEKLSLYGFRPTTKIIRSICVQNGQTLEILNLQNCWLDYHSCTQIFEHCKELKELNISQSWPGGLFLRREERQHISNIIPSKIEKLNIGGNGNLLGEQFLCGIFTRLENLKSLDLHDATGLSDESVTLIVDHLSDTLEELNLTRCYFSLEKLLELKSMKKLKVLRCSDSYLSNILHYLKDSIKDIGKGELDIANSSKFQHEKEIWEIQAEQLEMFREH